MTLPRAVDDPGLTPSPALAVRGLFAGIALLMVGNGLQGSLLGLRAESAGFSLVVTGVVMGLYFAGFLAGGRLAPRLLTGVGHIRVFAALASTASSAVLVHAVLVSPLSWGLMRFTTGMCMAGLYIVCESWLNELATNETRGRLLSMYMVVMMGGMTVGQFLLDVADTDGFVLFALASILVSLSLVPVTLYEAGNPPVRRHEGLSVREVHRRVPVGAVVVLGRHVGRRPARVGRRVRRRRGDGGRPDLHLPPRPSSVRSCCSGRSAGSRIRSHAGP
ncbi:MAG: hypothetical protein R2695_04635 [Acidimicrobiales bacterium]